MKELQTELKLKWVRLESGFTTRWLKSLKDKGFYVDKISDWSIWTKVVDCYIRTNISSYCCEIKVIDKDIFQVSRLRPNQRKGLRTWTNLWWKAIVCVYSKVFNQYKIIPFEVLADLDTDSSVKLKFN